MKIQQVLIVDDSKTARVMLHKMLDKQHIVSAMVESGEEALEYLSDNHPDVIFMDHMMPGMDGFAAVKAIKADPEKSSIPIIMHTTKQGDIYLGQARALGAIDILSKPANDQSLVDVLNRVQKNTRSPSVKAPVAAVAAGNATSDYATSDNVTDSHVTDSHASDNNTTGGVLNDSWSAVPDAASVEPELLVATANPLFSAIRQCLRVVIWLLPVIWLLFLYLSSQEQLQGRQQQQRVLIKALEWAVNQQESYDYGEAPMSGQRLILLRGLVSALSTAGFTGVIRLEGHVGEFCLTQIPLADGSHMVMLPGTGLPVSACHRIGASATSAMEQSIAQSDDFRAYVKAAGLMEEGSAIRVELIPLGASNPRYAYPAELGGISTGDWNTVALNNNRVHFVLLVD